MALCNIRNKIPLSIARKVFEVVNGVLVWKQCNCTKKLIGKPAGSVGVNGYVELSYNYRGKRRRLYAHRVAYALYHDKWPDKMVDHINGNRSDNRVENLRLCDDSQNMMNTKLRANNKTGVVGVSAHKDGGYEAMVSAYGVRHRKYFKDLKLAKEWVSQKREVLHGNRARKCQ